MDTSMKGDTDSVSLNPEQQRAVTHMNKPLLILAGAGSGKTMVITMRIMHLIREAGIHPRNILALTFTNRAANEMAERVEMMLGNKGRQALISTFHSACVKILRRHIQRLGYSNNFKIMDEKGRLRVIRTIMERFKFDGERLEPEYIASIIDRAKNFLLGPVEYLRKTGDYSQEELEMIFSGYEKEMKQNNTVDFGDLIMLTVRLFDEYPEVLESYRDRFRHIMVDEYQDTNHAQYRLVNMLTSSVRNICVVGDDDQSIYAWRGADIQNIFNFEKDYPEAAVIKLEQNYRCSRNILGAAVAVVSNNTRRTDKSLWTYNPDGDAITCHTSDDEYGEALFIAKTILDSVSSGKRRFGDFAVLYRTNAQSRVIEERLSRTGIPYSVVGGFRFYDRKEIKDILAYLRLVANPADSESLKRIINTPARGIGEAAVESIEKYAASLGAPIYDAIKELPHDHLGGCPVEKLQAFYSDMERFMKIYERNPVAMVVQDILETTGYIRQLKNKGSASALERLENLEEFVGAAEEFDENFGGDLREFLDRVDMVNGDCVGEDEPGMVNLMTVHSSKGLEFPVVFMTGMEEGLFPQQRAMETPEEVEEERRLCYVGMTRAKEKLCLVNARVRHFLGSYEENPPSRFLGEIPARFIDYLHS